MVDPFHVIMDGGDSERHGEQFSRTLSSRMRQIESTLTAALPRNAAPDGAIIEGVVPKQIERSAVLQERIEFGDVKPFGVDVAGILNTARRSLQSGDRLHGTVVLRDDRADVFAELAADGEWTAGPWDFSANGRLLDAADQLAHRVVQELLSQPSLRSLTIDQFTQFVLATRSYQAYVRSPSPRSQADLAEAKTRFETLQTDGVKVAEVYSYLASIRTLQDPKDIDGPIALLRTASSLDPSSTGIAGRLRDLENRRPTVAAQPVAPPLGPSLLNQPSLVAVRLEEARANVTQQRSVRIGLLADAVDPTAPGLGARVQTHSVVAGDNESDESFDHATHLASYLATIAPNATIVSIEVLGSRGSGTNNDIANGMRLALDLNLDLLLVPLSSPNKSAFPTELFERATRSGLAIIAAAGNAAESSLPYPAAVPSVIAIGATELDDRRARYSNWGNEVALYAPGQAVALTRNGAAQQREGTSYSAALAAGVVALMLENGFRGSPEDIRKVLTRTARRTAADLPVLDSLAAILATSTNAAGERHAAANDQGDQP